MTRRIPAFLIIPGFVEVDDVPPSFDAETDGVDVDEPSAIVPTIKHVLAKTMPQLEERRKASK